MLAVLADFGNVGIAIGILSMLLAPLANATGAVLMSLYQAMVNRLVIPVIEAHKAEGREEGRKQGRTEVMEEWRAWNRRRLAVSARAWSSTNRPRAKASTSQTDHAISVVQQIARSLQFEIRFRTLARSRRGRFRWAAC